jgi:hypothetical protein
MSSEYFDYSPSVELLQILARGNLKQNLFKAVRLWVILRSLYGDEADPIKLHLGETFTYNDWSNLFFTTKTDEYNQAPQCPRSQTISEWLFDPHTGVEASDWQNSFLQLYPMQPEQLNNLLSFGKPVKTPQTSKVSSCLESPLFAVDRRSIQYDFQTLVELRWLNVEKKYAEKSTGRKSQRSDRQKLQNLTFFTLKSLIFLK